MLFDTSTQSILTSPIQNDFFDDSISNEQWYLNEILTGRFKLVNENTIYDAQRNLYTTVKGNINSKGKKEYMKYEINIYTPQKKRRKILYHRFVWMYYSREIIPKGTDIHHKDENRSNNYHENLEAVVHKIHVSNHSIEKYPLLKDKLYCNETIDKMSKSLKEHYQLKYNYCYQEKKICSSCKRFLPLSYFYRNSNPELNIQYSSHCKECVSIRDTGRISQLYKFPENVIDDATIVNIRFKYNIIYKTFSSILKKYRHMNLTRNDLHDILIGKTYTHIDLFHGIRRYPFREENKINQTEYAQILNAMLEGNFTVDEITIMHGVKKEIIEDILNRSKYKSRFISE